MVFVTPPLQKSVFRLWTPQGFLFRQAQYCPTLVLLLNKLKEPEVVSTQGLLCHNTRRAHAVLQEITEGREEFITLLRPRLFIQQYREQSALAAESPRDNITDQGLKSAAVEEELEDEQTSHDPGCAGSQGKGIPAARGGRKLTEAGASLLPVEVRVLAVTDFFGS